MCVYGQCVGVSRQTNLVTSLISLVNVSRVACWCFLGSTREFQGQRFNQWRFPFVSRAVELTASFSSLQHTDKVSNKPTSFNYQNALQTSKISPAFRNCACTATVLPKSEARYSWVRAFVNFALENRVWTPILVARCDDWSI